MLDPKSYESTGNNKADSAAKYVPNKEIDPKFMVRYTDLKNKIKRFIKQRWQQCWNSSASNKLLSIKPTQGEWKLGYKRSQEEEVTQAHLCIGHTRIMHSFILKQEKQPLCVTCQTLPHRM